MSCGSDHDLLVAYSEWLDADVELMKAPEDGDERTHSDLVTDFLAAHEEETTP